MDGYDFEVPTEFVASRVSETFQELGDRKEVRLVKLGLGVKQLELLCDKLSQHGNELEKLQLGGNKLGDNGVRRLSQQALPACGKLLDLHLGDNHVGSDGLRSLARDGLCCVPELRRLSLQGNDIDDEAVEALSEEGLPSCSKLQVVCLHGNKKISTRGVRALAKAAAEHCPELEHIQIDKLPSKLGLGLAVDRRDADNLAKITKEVGLPLLMLLLALYVGDIEEARSVQMPANGSRDQANTVTQMSFANLDAEGIELLVRQVLPRCPATKHLYLGRNRMGDAALGVLAGGLHYVGRTLEGLHLHCNDLTVVGMEVLTTSAFPNLSALRMLSLSNNSLGDEGVEIFSKQGLPHCGSLLELDLSANGIGERGANALGDGLKHASKLSVLKLNDNNLGNAGVVGLCRKAFQSDAASRLVTLDLKHNAVGDAGAEALISGLVNCSKLINFGFRENVVTVPVLRRMKAAFSESMPRLVNLAVDVVEDVDEAHSGRRGHALRDESKAETPETG